MTETRESLRWVDMTPDEGLPARILEAYIDEAHWEGTGGAGPEHPVVVEMNRHREERNRVLRAALDRLGAR